MSKLLYAPTRSTGRSFSHWAITRLALIGPSQSKAKLVVKNRMWPPGRTRSVRRFVTSGAWFVVAATYTRQKDAAKRAQSIARRWPRFKAEVYAPPLENQKPYYLVILGGNLSQNAAAALQERARTAGVARDAYVTRFQR